MMGISTLVCAIAIYSMIDSANESCFVSGSRSHTWDSNCFICFGHSYVRSALWFGTYVQGVLQTSPSTSTKETRKDGSSGRDNPAGLVINSFPTMEASPTILPLKLCLGKLVAVIQPFAGRGSSAMTPTTASSLLCPVLCFQFSPGDSNLLLSEVASSSPVHSLILGANADVYFTW